MDSEHKSFSLRTVCRVRLKMYRSQMLLPFLWHCYSIALSNFLIFISLIHPIHIIITLICIADVFVVLVEICIVNTSDVCFSIVLFL